MENEKFIHEAENISAEISEESKAENVNADDPKPVGRAANKRRKEEVESSEATDAPVEKLDDEKAMRVLEAILFANGDEVYYDQFAKIAGLSNKEAARIAEELEKVYNAELYPRGIRMVRYDKCCQLTTCPDLGEYVTKMVGIRGEPQLSPAALECLAIIAYNQPVTRVYVEQVRGVDCTRPITTLLDRELIEERGRLDVIGRPRLFGTTQTFLRTFGINSLADLPTLELFKTE